MSAIRTQVFLALILFAVSSEADLYLHTNLKCVSTTERREVHIYQDSADPSAGPVCRVDYMKQGAINTLWTAQSDAGFCVAKARELATILEKSNFKCVATAVFDEPSQAKE